MWIIIKIDINREISVFHKLLRISVIYNCFKDQNRYHNCFQALFNHIIDRIDEQNKNEATMSDF